MIQVHSQTSDYPLHPEYKRNLYQLLLFRKEGKLLPLPSFPGREKLHSSFTYPTLSKTYLYAVGRRNDRKLEEKGKNNSNKSNSNSFLLGFLFIPARTSQKWEFHTASALCSAANSAEYAIVNRTKYWIAGSALIT